MCPRFSGAALILNMMSLCPHKNGVLKIPGFEHTNIIFYIALGTQEKKQKECPKSLVRQFALPLAQNIRVSDKLFFCQHGQAKEGVTFLYVFKNPISLGVLLLALLSV